MRRRQVRIIILAVAVLAAAGIYTVGRELRRPAELSVLRDSLQALRAAADSCRFVFDAAQSGLLESAAGLDSARDRVRQLEARDPRGVPADSYRIYLDIFEMYGDSVAAWDGRVAALQAAREDCYVITEAHNELADTLRRRQGQPPAAR
jgi:hypothetical protein